MTTPSDTAQKLKELAREGQAILAEYLEYRSLIPSSGLADETLGAMAGSAACSLAESPYIGRVAETLTRGYLRQQRQQSRREAEQRYEARYNDWFSRVTGFLQEVSEWRAALKSPNSRKLVDRVVRSQSFVKLETRLRRGCACLLSIALNPLVSNPSLALPTQIVVHSGQPFEAGRKLQALLARAEGYVKVFDKYVGPATLDHLAAIRPTVKTMLLTLHMGGQSGARRFLRECSDFASTHPEFELRVAAEDRIHDRIIITRDTGWTVGQSIMDVGRKSSMIVRLEENARRNWESIFDDAWNKSRPPAGHRIQPKPSQTGTSIKIDILGATHSHNSTARSSPPHRTRFRVRTLLRNLTDDSTTLVGFSIEVDDPNKGPVVTKLARSEPALPLDLDAGKSRELTLDFNVDELLLSEQDLRCVLQCEFTDGTSSQELRSKFAGASWDVPVF